jgi:hypothetical protein
MFQDGQFLSFQAVSSLKVSDATYPDCTFALLKLSQLFDVLGSDVRLENNFLVMFRDFVYS